MKFEPFDLTAKDARIVDGLGGPARMGDVGIIGDRIVAVGVVHGHSCETIDAAGQVLSPGFIDIHTHYDPQLCWDGMASPSPEHGVTTVIIGNCSLSLAPIRPEGQVKISTLFGSVEDLDRSYIDAAVPYSWESFGEYLDHIKARGLGPNVGALVGHSALRIYVMGEAAQARVATDAELALMGGLLQEAVKAGAFGMSLTYAHKDEQGEDLPCSFADDRELLALYRALASGGRGLVECAPNPRDPEKVLALIDQLAAFSLETGVTTSFSPILYSPGQDGWLRQMSRIITWQQRGAPVHAQTQTRPLDMTFRLSRGSMALLQLRKWGEVMSQPVPKRIEMLSDRALWPVLDAELGSMPVFDAVVVGDSTLAANERYKGQHVREIARQEDRSYADVMLSLALPEDLETEFEVTNYTHADGEIVSLMLNHQALQIGSADAGAHIGQFSGAGDTTYLLQHFVRKLGAMSLERAVQRLTSDLARSWHIEDRGVIAEGMYADLVLFDPDEISRGDQIWVRDLPGGGGRYIRHASGIQKVIVNGQLIVDAGSYTQARPGQII
jgi:N-acyl-D-amino-acid deacylase